MSTPTVAEQLIAGGRDLIGREGAGDLSVRRLVEAAGRSTMCVYTHFGNRKRLLAEIYRSCGDDLRSDLATADSPEALDRRYLAYAEARPRHFQYLFSTDLEHLDMDPGLRSDLIESIVLLVAERRGGQSRPEALAAWLRVHGVAWLDTVQGLAGEPGRFDTSLALAPLPADEA